MHYFDSYPIKSRIRKVHPIVKLVSFAVYTAMALGAPSIAFLALMMVCFFVLTVYTARISVYRLVRLLFIPATFVLLGSLSVVLDVNPVAPIYTIGVGNLFLGMSAESIYRGGLLFAHSFSSILILYSLVLNTPVSDIIYVLRKMRVSEVILDLLVLVYRTIFILSDTAQRIYIAQKSRMGHRNLKTSLRSTAQLGGSAFILAGVRAEQLFHSMESRGYTGRIYSLPAEWESSKKFILVSVTMFVALLGLFLLIN